MQMLSPGSSLKEWHDFYSLIGGASATLVALMFVAASIGAGVFKRDQHGVGIRSFLSPTVAHFSAIVIICLLGSIPIETWTSLGALEAGAGAIGLVYSTFIWHRMIRHGMFGQIDLADRLWYALLPTAAYSLVIGAGISLLLQSQRGLDILALALILLLVLGVRNAWDMTIWIIDRRQD